MPEPAKASARLRVRIGRSRRCPSCGARVYVAGHWAQCSRCLWRAHAKLDLRGGT